MRVINDRAGVRLGSMAQGETFIYEDEHWIVTDYEDSRDNILCVDLSSGLTSYLSKEWIVIPVPAEVHIL